METCLGESLEPELFDEASAKRRCVSAVVWMTRPAQTFNVGKWVDYPEGGATLGTLEDCLFSVYGQDPKLWHAFGSEAVEFVFGTEPATLGDSWLFEDKYRQQYCKRAVWLFPK